MGSKTTVGVLVIGAVAAVASLEAWQWREGAPALAQPVARSPAPALANENAMPFAGRLARQRLSGEVIGEPFGVREAPRAVVTAPPPVAPVAAPFPYRYAGQLGLGDGKTRVYLVKGNDLVLINVGDVLEGVFQVTALAEDSLEVLHLPTAIATQMQFSAMVADAAGTGTVGVARSASGSMPMLPGPVGVMGTLPSPMGRLGI